MILVILLSFSDLSSAQRSFVSLSLRPFLKLSIDPFIAVAISTPWTLGELSRKSAPAIFRMKFWYGWAMWEKLCFVSSIMPSG